MKNRLRKYRIPKRLQSITIIIYGESNGIRIRMHVDLWINMSGFTLTINLRACKLYKRSDEKRVEIRFKATNRNTNTHQLHPKTFIKQTILDIYSERISLRMRVSVRACVRMWVVQAYFTWLTRNWIFKLAFCNSNMCGCRCSLLLFSHFSHCPWVSPLLSKRTLWFPFPFPFWFTPHNAWWIFVVQKPHQSELWCFTFHRRRRLCDAPGPFQTLSEFRCASVCVFAFAMRQRPTDWAFQIYLVHFVSVPSHLSHSLFSPSALANTSI